MKATIKFSRAEIEELIKAKLATTGIKVIEVTPGLVDVSGYGEDWDFDGYEVKVELKEIK